jgi:hypothetical protein
MPWSDGKTARFLLKKNRAVVYTNIRKVRRN